MEVRALTEADLAAVQQFFSRVPEGDRTFFKEDVLNAAEVSRWASADRGRRLVAVEGSEVIGFTAVVPQHGWSSHVGELRLVVDPSRRGQGLGRQLARAALLEALSLGLSKIYVEVVADQTAAVGMFQALGFEAEALLRNHVRTRDGETRDLFVLAHSVDDAWSGMATAGIEEALTGS